MSAENKVAACELCSGKLFASRSNVQRHFETIHKQLKAVTITDRLQIIPKVYKSKLRVLLVRKAQNATFQSKEKDLVFCFYLKQYGNFRVFKPDESANIQEPQVKDLGYDASLTFDGQTYEIKNKYVTFVLTDTEFLLLRQNDALIEEGIEICKQMLTELASM